MCGVDGTWTEKKTYRPTHHLISEWGNKMMIEGG